MWKLLDECYAPGRRVEHWVKRKRGVEIEAFVTGCKPGTPERGHSHLVGAVEFSVRDENGNAHPIAWVSGWNDVERQAMTEYDADGAVRLRRSYLGRSALVIGQEYSAKSRRLRHARLIRWISSPRNLKSNAPFTMNVAA